MNSDQIPRDSPRLPAGKQSSFIHSSSRKGEQGERELSSVGKEYWVWNAGITTPMDAVITSPIILKFSQLLVFSTSKITDFRQKKKKRSVVSVISFPYRICAQIPGLHDCPVEEQAFGAK